jgi:hypothetical protein
MAASEEPRNPLYLLLLVSGLIFIATVLAYAVVPMLEEKAMDAGQMPPPSPFRDALRNDGWKWVLIEVGVIVILGIASMGLDRYRRWKKERAGSPISSTAIQAAPPAPFVGGDERK